jgi:hypothetical protein
MRAALVVAAALLLAPTTAERLRVDGDNVRSIYKSFDRLTAEPVEVSAWLSAACAPDVGGSRREHEVERAGPHAEALAQLYSHGVDASIFASPERQFPVGTIVVKEKLASDLTATGVGGMQKMEPGYDPEGADWLYFYSSPSSGFTSGRLDTCRSCHLRARESDFVYFVKSHDSARPAR